ncbi:MAG TPA: hypothetical protein VEZ89_18380 [Rubrivivax sp.]|nr:hypothetical protein [Rubrivivax sp.]
MPPTPASPNDPRASAVLEILAAHARVQAAQLHSGMRAEELGLSRLEMALALFDIENCFDVDLAPIAHAEARTVGQLVQEVLSCADKQPVLLDS